MDKGMNTLKPIKDATTSFSRSVLGTLLFAFGLFLCSSFSAQAHIDNDVSRQFEALLEAARGWRQLDAALARSERNLFASISETLNGNISQTTARTPKSVTDKPLPHSSGYAAALASAPVLPQISVTPVALPIGTPLCFLPAERGLVSYPTPPPYGC